MKDGNVVRPNRDGANDLRNERGALNGRAEGDILAVVGDGDVDESLAVFCLADGLEERGEDGAAPVVFDDVAELREAEEVEDNVDAKNVFDDVEGFSGEGS